MPIKIKGFFIITILLNIMVVSDCMAVKAANPFQNRWSNDHGDVTIEQCHGVKCKIEIVTANGAHFCEVKEELTVLSNNTAVFYAEDSVDALDGKKKLFPINISLSKQTITVAIPNGSELAAGEYCGMRGFFHGEYTNSKVPRIYKASFNCDKARTRIEVAICHSKDLAYADSVLSKLYFQLKAQKRNQTVNEQKEWIKEREVCSNVSDLNQCLSRKYSDRILTLEKNFIDNRSESKKGNAVIPYNFRYFLYLSKDSETSPYAIFKDPPLQSYFKAFLPKETVEEILPTRFYEIGFEYHDNSLIMIAGGAPGLYTIYEGALVLMKDHQTWLAYIDIDNDSKKQIIVVYPQNANTTAMPVLLKQWVDRLLPNMDYKNVVYKPLFPSA